MNNSSSEIDQWEEDLVYKIKKLREDYSYIIGLNYRLRSSNLVGDEDHRVLEMALKIVHDEIQHLEAELLIHKLLGDTQD